MIPALLTLALAAPAPALAADPLAPAWAGQVQCYTPDLAAKTCSSIGAYRRTADGKIFNLAIVAIAKAPAVVMTTEAEVTVRKGEICGAISPEDVARASFTIDGAPATAAQTDRIRPQMAAAMQPLFGHEVCSTAPPPGRPATARASVDGVHQPAMDQTTAWVSGDAGYQVRLP